MRQRRTVTVPRPQEETFAFLADPRNLASWVPAVETIELVDPPEQGPLDVGTRFRQHVATPTEGQGSFDARIRTSQPPRRVAYTTQGETGTITTAFTLEPHPEGTRVTQTLTMPLNGWATRILAPILWVVNRSRMKTQLESLKTTLEHDPPTPPPLEAR